MPVNCVTFDHLGTRMFAGDATGILTELSVDLTSLWDLPPCMTCQEAPAASSPSRKQTGCTGGNQCTSGSGLQNLGSTTDSDRAGSCLRQEAAAVASAAAAYSSMVATVLRHGNAATQQLAGAGSQQPCIALLCVC